MKRLRIVLIVSALAVLTNGFASAAERWQTLPPTPTLPKPALTGHATVNGARLWYAQWNTAGHGVPVLLLHGGYANSSYFGHLIRDLVKHGYRVIAMDSRGHGRSTRSDAPYTYHLMAEDVVGLLKSLTVKRVSLVGWSDGGSIGYDLALNHPELLARLFSYGANADLTGLKDDYDKTPVFAAYLKRVPEEYKRLSPTPGAWDSFDAAIGKMWSTEPNYTAEQLRSIRTPTMLADGEHDEALKPEHLKYLSTTIPGARLEFLAGTSHFAMLQDPVAFDAAVIDFLDGK